MAAGTRPCVIAKAAVERRTVVTVEELKPNAVKVPNICEQFSIKCLSLEAFMDAEGWESRIAPGAAGPAADVSPGIWSDRVKALIHRLPDRKIGRASTVSCT